MTPFEKAEMVLALEPEIAAEKKEKMTAGVADPEKKSAQGRAPQTRDELAGRAGVSHDTIAAAAVFRQSPRATVQAFFDWP